MRALFSFFLSFFLLANAQFAQGQGELSYEADSIFCAAKDMYRKRQFDECLLALQKSNAMFLEDKNWESYIETLAQLGVQTSVLKDSLEGHSYMNKAIRLADSLNIIDKHVHSVTYSVKGNAFYWSGDYEATLFYWEKSLEVLKTSSVLDHEYQLSMLNNLGYVYEALGAYEKTSANHLNAVLIAEETFGAGDPKTLYRVNKWIKFLIVKKEYNKVWKELLKRKSYYETLDNTYNVKADYYLILATYYIARQDYSEAENYLTLAENIYEKLGDGNNNRRQQIYSTWAVLEESQGHLEKAIPHYLKSLELHRAYPYHTVHVIATALMNVGNCYSNMGEYEQAVSYMNDAIKAMDESDIHGLYHARVYYYRALMYLHNEEYDLAIADLEYALSKLSDDKGNLDELTGKYNSRIGDCYLGKGDLEKAAFYFDKGISLFHNSEDNELDIFSVGDKRVLSELLTAKMKLIFSDSTLGGLEGMKEVLEDAEKVDQLLRHMMHYTRSEDSKLSLNDMFHENSDLGVKACHKLLELTGDEDYMKEAFLWSVKGKANLLQAEIKGNSDKLKGNIPDSLLEKELQVNAGISFYEEKLFEATGDQKEKKWNKILVDLRLEREKLIAHYEAYYPKYFELKYSNTKISLAEIQESLEKGESLLDYFLGNDALYVFVIDQKEMYFKRVVLEEDLAEIIAEFRTFLKASDFDGYTKTSYELYQKLVAPVEDYIKGKELYIVPHGVISYLPFDALISELPVSKAYHELSYMTKAYDISYLYNSKLMDVSYDKVGVDGYLGVVPSYDEFYKPLIYAEKEVDEISASLSGEKIVGNAATETFVRDNASHYDILHFASHAEIDEDTAMLSRLILEKDSINDGSLYTYELYNMELSSSLVVLNACNTGEGKLYAADGIISLASGFQFAGCESVFMNLWEVPDQSSSVLITTFFKYLKEGSCKRSSLSQAKRDYLEASDEYTANPIFWAGGVVSGNLSPIENAVDYMKYYYIVGGFLFFLLFLNFIKK